MLEVRVKCDIESGEAGLMNIVMSGASKDVMDEVSDVINGMMDAFFKTYQLNENVDKTVAKIQFLRLVTQKVAGVDSIILSEEDV